MSRLFKGLERIEEARERMAGASFMAGLYDGRPDFTLLFPTEEPPEERAAGEAYCDTIQSFLILTSIPTRSSEPPRFLTTS